MEKIENFEQKLKESIEKIKSIKTWDDKEEAEKLKTMINASYMKRGINKRVVHVEPGFNGVTLIEEDIKENK